MKEWQYGALNWQEMIFQFLGGLGLFLFAIKYMGDGLQKAAGDRLRDILKIVLRQIHLWAY